MQFADGEVNTTAPVVNKEWPVRGVAAAVYYAQHAFAGLNNGSFAASISDLMPYLESPDIVDGTCTMGTPVSLGVFTDGSGASRFNASIPPSSVGDPSATAKITDQRYLTVSYSNTL